SSVFSNEFAEMLDVHRAAGICLHFAERTASKTQDRACFVEGVVPLRRRVHIRMTAQAEQSIFNDRWQRSITRNHEPGQIRCRSTRDEQPARIRRKSEDLLEPLDDLKLDVRRRLLESTGIGVHCGGEHVTKHSDRSPSANYPTPESRMTVAECKGFYVLAKLVVN